MHISPFGPTGLNFLHIVGNDIETSIFVKDKIIDMYLIILVWSIISAFGPIYLILHLKSVEVSKGYAVTEKQVSMFRS